MTCWQPEGSENITPDRLSIPLAAGFFRHVRDDCADFADFAEARRWALPAANDETMEIEIVSVCFRTERPQRPVYAILQHETVSVAFFPENRHAPIVFVAREDFPDTPHQNLSPSGFPFQPCIDDRPWGDVMSGYSAAELVGRICAWFSKAAVGELR